MGISLPRPFRRLLLVLAGLLVFAILSFLLEPRRHSISCRSFWTCINPIQSAPYQFFPLPEEQQISVTESTLADGVLKFNRKLGAEIPSVLFLVVTRDGHSWSRDFQSTRRSVYDFLDLLASTQLEPKSVALGLMTESKAEYDLLRQATDQIPLGRITILWRNSTVSGVDFGSEVGDVNNAKAGFQRKASMARQRNYLMTRALADEKYVVWVDAGVVEFSPGMVQGMIKHAEDRSDVGIVTARCERDKNENYDTSAWAISKTSKLFAMTNGFDQTDPIASTAELARSLKMVPELIKGTVDGDLIELNSVGDTILFVKADLIRQGLMFPWWKVVGTTWREDGWIGIDTEGLCYISKRMSGGGCFMLGGTNKVRHTDWG